MKPGHCAHCQGSGQQTMQTFAHKRGKRHTHQKCFHCKGSGMAPISEMERLAQALRRVEREGP